VSRVFEVGEYTNSQITVRKAIDTHCATGKTLIINELETVPAGILQMSAHCSPITIAWMTASEDVYAIRRRTHGYAVCNLVTASDLYLGTCEPSRSRVNRDPCARATLGEEPTNMAELVKSARAKRPFQQLICTPQFGTNPSGECSFRKLLQVGYFASDYHTLSLQPWICCPDGFEPFAHKR
jgi:hypothetical protein